MKRFMSKKNYVEVVSWNGMRWLFPKDGSGFMTVKELENIDRGQPYARKAASES